MQFAPDDKGVRSPFGYLALLLLERAVLERNAAFDAPVGLLVQIPEAAEYQCAMHFSYNQISTPKLLVYRVRYEA